MNDYDDSDDYSSANSFRARSNTWPLNRPDLAVPNSVCIDETLPEIELEEDDLFTTNENWNTGLIDHDIMSWDPILNAQSNHNHNHHHHQQQQHQHQSTATFNQQQQPTATAQHQHPSRQQQQQQHPQPIHQHQTHPQEALIGDNTITLSSQVQQHHLPPQHQQTLNSAHCLDTDDPNEYHVQQMHHLRLDNNQTSSDHQTHYMTPLSSMCIQGSTTLGNENYISPNHHHLQPLTSARYDLDQHTDLNINIKSHGEDDQQHQQQLHQLTSSSLDHHHPINSQMIQTTLNSSGIGLNGDLEDLDYKEVVPNAVLQGNHFEEQQQIDQQQLQGENSGNVTKPQGSASSSKTKLNTPRRNAWGNMSYADLISQAINSTNDKRLTLSQIYDWMVQHVPYFKDKGDSNSSAGWKNSVRHNLSLHNRFKRLQNEGTGKSSWWTINPEANVGKCARRRAASMEASKYEKKRGRAKKRADAIRQGLVSYPSLTNSSLNGSTSNLDQLQPQQQLQTPNQFGSQPQQIDALSSENNLSDIQPNIGLYATPAQDSAQYEQNDNSLQQQLQSKQQSQSPPSSTPSKPVVVQQQQPRQEQQPTQNQVHHQPVHQQLQKMELHDTDSYYIQQRDLQQHDHHHQQQILNSSDHMDLFGRHAIYLSEPCNDCNCAELINCGANAMSFT